MNCRHCGVVLSHVFVDLGFAPPSNRYVEPASLDAPEVFYPLKVFVCDHCWLVQTQDCVGSEALFTSDYAYFSSTSRSWLQHARRFAEVMIARLGLDAKSWVVEIASNDGYLLRNFVERGIPCLGIEPTHSTAAAARRLGIPVLTEFFGAELARSLAATRGRAHLIAGNNVYAHVPSLHDFTEGLRILLQPEGTITLEFPHLLRLIEGLQFDTIYHEHFSYLSLHVAVSIFRQHGLRIYDAESLPTHGGSLRLFGCHEASRHATQPGVENILAQERDAGMLGLPLYVGFQARVDRVKNDFLRFLLACREAGKSVAGYGAAAKGVSLVNYAGVKPDLLPFVCDAAASKQGKFLPGSHIPVVAPGRLRTDKPDFILILPWNIAAEIRSELHDATAWGAQFVTAIPNVSIGT